MCCIIPTQPITYPTKTVTTETIVNIEQVIGDDYTTLRTIEQRTTTTQLSPTNMIVTIATTDTMVTVSGPMKMESDSHKQL